MGTPKIGQRWVATPWDGIVADPQKHHACYHTEFHMEFCSHMGEPQKLGNTG